MVKNSNYKDSVGYKDIYSEVYSLNANELKDEPILMKVKRVEKLLDISPSSRKRLVDAGELVKVKPDESKPNSSVRITRDSVINLITDWQADAEYKSAIS